MAKLTRKQFLSIQQAMSYLDSQSVPYMILAKLIDDSPTEYTKNFRLEEFLSSPTAVKHNITLCPPDEALFNILQLCQKTLQPARDLLGSPIRVTSGYRNTALNRLVGGAPRSYHLFGRAADVICEDLDSLQAILETLPHTELIRYTNYIHVAL